MRIGDWSSDVCSSDLPVFFGSAVNNFGVQLLLDFFVRHAPSTRPRETTTRMVEPAEPKLSGFVFKIQANMDPLHGDRVAFLRVRSGHLDAGMEAFHVRGGQRGKLSNALLPVVSNRELAADEYAGEGTDLER